MSELKHSSLISLHDAFEMDQEIIMIYEVCIIYLSNKIKMLEESEFIIFSLTCLDIKNLMKQVLQNILEILVILLTKCLDFCLEST